jgi:hypothetical protein
MILRFVRMGFSIIASSLLVTPALVQAQQEAPIIQSSSLHPLCLAFPDRPLMKASSSTPKDVSCGWGTLESRGLADVDSFSGERMETFRVLQAWQGNDFLRAYDGQAGMQVEDRAGVTDCLESRVIIWRQNGKPYRGHATGLCDGVDLTFSVVGKYVDEIDAQFAKLVRSMRPK